MVGVSPRLFAIELSPQLLEWSKLNPVVSVGIDSDVAPLDYLDEDKNPIGIGALYRNELNKLLPVKLVVTSATDFASEIDYLKQTEIDILSFCSKSDRRSKDMLFTNTIWSWPSVLGIPIDSPINKIEDINLSTTIGAINGFINIDIAKDLVGKSNVTTSSDLFSGLEKTLNGDTDAFITTDHNRQLYC